jgi:hypothetical protein
LSPWFLKKSYPASEIFSLHDIRCLKFAHTTIFVGSSSQLDPPLPTAHRRLLPVSRHHELGTPSVRFRKLRVSSAGRRELWALSVAGHVGESREEDNIGEEEDGENMLLNPKCWMFFSLMF